MGKCLDNGNNLHSKIIISLIVIDVYQSLYFDSFCPIYLDYQCIERQKLHNKATFEAIGRKDTLLQNLTNRFELFISSQDINCLWMKYRKMIKLTSNLKDYIWISCLLHRSNLPISFSIPIVGRISVFVSVFSNLSLL